MAEKEWTYEQAVERLEAIVEQLEKNDIALDDALSLFEEGTKLTALCSQKLKEAKQRIIEVEKE